MAKALDVLGAAANQRVGRRVEEHVEAVAGGGEEGEERGEEEKEDDSVTGKRRKKPLQRIIEAAGDAKPLNPMRYDLEGTKAKGALPLPPSASLYEIETKLGRGRRRSGREGGEHVSGGVGGWGGGG